MNVVLTEKVFLTVSEILIIEQFKSLIGEINDCAQSGKLCNACDNVLVKITELDDYLFPM